MNDQDPGSHPNQRVPLAYENKKFLDGPDGRILRILAEYQEPLSKFRRERIQDTIVFFGSARFRSRETAEAELRSIKEAGVSPAEAAELLKRAQSNLEMSRYYEDARQAGIPHQQVDPDNRATEASLRGVHWRRTGHHGGRQPRGF